MIQTSSSILSNDDCSGVMLDDVDSMVRIFKNANISDIDPAPMLRLVNYQKKRADYAESVKKVNYIAVWTLNFF